MDAEDFERLTGARARRDFKQFLRSAPDFGALEIERSAEPARRLDHAEPGTG
ncbi:MAG TPA: hypothetical protein VFZ77_04325 [Acidimicrobiales bacterium]